MILTWSEGENWTLGDEAPPAFSPPSSENALEEDRFSSTMLSIVGEDRMGGRLRFKARDAKVFITTLARASTRGIAVIPVTPCTVCDGARTKYG